MRELEEILQQYIRHIVRIKKRAGVNALTEKQQGSLISGPAIFMSGDTMEAHKQALQNLINVNEWSLQNLLLRRLNRIVLEDPRFITAPGGVTKHHDYKHGLVLHVSEVMSNVNKMTGHSASDELITAVIWHDYMKIKEYTLDPEGEVVKLPYRNKIRHVAGSAMEFHAQAASCLPTETLERVEHLLLSHHGRKEWGSPIEPATAEAFILHAADMMSACGVNL